MLLCFPTISTALPKFNIETEQSCLLALKSNMFDPSNVLSSWNSSTRIPVCNWTRVVCSARHQRVVSLNLSYAGLQGSIAPQIGNLSFLAYFDVEGNSLQGGLPVEMMNLRRLRYINLNYNSFSGDVPPWLGYLPSLETIRFANNSFTGAIPGSLFNASRLEDLSIPFNRLQGNIPPEIGNFENGRLKYLNMNGNRITGSIPQSISNLTSLEAFAFTFSSLSGNLPVNICSKNQNLRGVFLALNELSGQIQSRFQNCSQLQILNLSLNRLNGGIPKEIGNLTSLTDLYMESNNFTGEIPSAIGNLINLNILALGLNGGLSGHIPQEIGNLPKLSGLGLSGNRLSGSIPSSIFNMSSLTTISLVGNSISGNIPLNLGFHQVQYLLLALNRLSGVIPDSISNLTKLIKLDLSSNQLTGSIPASFGTLTFLTFFNLELNHLGVGSSGELKFLTSLTNCTKLNTISMSINPIRGTLPRSIGNFSSSLHKFYAACELEGNIPHEIGKLSGMVFLTLGGNLSGPLPMEFQRLKNLQALDLNGNNISGPIPNYFCDFKQLGYLDLSDSQLSGQVPECFGNMTSLRYLNLHSNKLNSTLSSTQLTGLVDLLELDLHSNYLSGDIPLEIGNMKVATLIDLSNNNFSGLIPASIGYLNNLINLSLSHNQLHGSIPEKVSSMLSLEYFDLSHNNLTGHLPKALGLLSQLKYFNVSFNELGGEIPSNGSFKNFTYESFMSNGAFCGGPPQFQLPPCPSDLYDRKSRAKQLHLLAYIVIPISLVIFVVAFGIIIRLYKRAKNKEISFETNGRISFYELQRATNNFNETNLISSGGYGSVYKGVLRNGTMIAAKVFDMEVEGSFKSFDRECDVLRNVRHRNLVKVITSCSNLDFKALVLEYMPNGSLEKWLYSHNYFLDFSKRLDIMIDVASALVYLHHEYSSTIIHCDLKPSNVLFDEDMTGRVCDFGLAKLFAGDESMTQTKTLATIGYIAPEYGFEGKVSSACDVYSFGILLMETFSRKKPTDEMFSEDWGLRDWIDDLMKNSSTYFIDQNLINSQDISSRTLVHCVSEIMELALKCTVESIKDRFDMKLVLAKLQKARHHLEESN